MGRYLKGPFPLALYYVHMSNLLKYNAIQYNNIIVILYIFYLSFCLFLSASDSATQKSRNDLPTKPLNISDTKLMYANVFSLHF